MNGPSPEHVLDDGTCRYRYRMRAIDLGQEDLETLLAHDVPGTGSPRPATRIPS